MKSNHWIIVLGISLLAFAGTAGAAHWEVKANIPHTVYGHGAAAVGDRLYIVGGCETADWKTTSARLQIYDSTRDTWTTGASLPIELGWPMVAVFRDIIYVFGGMRSGAVSTDRAWVYDPSQNTWAAIGPLPVKAMNGVAIAVGESIYVGLGYQRVDGSAKGVSENFLSFYRYDPTDNSYTRLADAPEGACYAAIGTYESHVYVVHGARYEVGFHDMKDYGWADDVLKYQPASNAWTKLDIPRVQPRLFFLTQSTSSAYHGEKLLIVGGHSHYRRTNVAGYFDMRREQFFGLPDLPNPRCCGAGGVIGETLILAGGFWGVGETGDPARPTWLLNLADLPEPGETITNSIGMKFAYIPPGRFLRGTPWEKPDRQYDERPHAVRITKPFRIGVTEVTQAQWEAVMGVNRSNFRGADLPVEKISWREAVEFCERLSRKEARTYRLPTEAEWEYACQAGATGPFAGTGRLDDMAWYDGNSGGTTHPIGTKQPNAWGLYDTHGNVAEWCSDIYDADYPKTEAVDPVGPSEGLDRVIRGGSWAHFPLGCRSAARNSAPPSYQFRETGFRVVLEISP
jgi:formylglycine-generating enzyme required for sulfatase activity/N-acetylneuraminic acid mutarotase